MRSVEGFSLLEVLAALALLALLLLGVYSGVSSSSAAVRHGAAAIDRLDEIRGARDFLRRELVSATSMPWALDAHDLPIVFEGAPDAVRFVAPLPGYLGKTGMQMVSARIVDDADHVTQHIEVSFAPLPTAAVKPPVVTAEPLLTGMTGLSFRYADAAGVWHERWRDRSLLPSLVEIVGRDRKRSSWPRLTAAPRQSPWALNPTAIGQALGREDDR